MYGVLAIVVIRMAITLNTLRNDESKRRLTSRIFVGRRNRVRYVMFCDTKEIDDISEKMGTCRNESTVMKDGTL